MGTLLHYDVHMTTFADSLKKEIARVARRVLRDEIAALRKAAATHRAEIAGVKKLLRDLQMQVNRLEKRSRETLQLVSPIEHASMPPALKGKPGRKVVFTAQRLKAQRARLGFTQEQMAKLLGVSALSIWKWEKGGAVPRASRVPKILERLALGKREAESQIAT